MHEGFYFCNAERFNDVFFFAKNKDNPLLIDVFEFFGTKIKTSSELGLISAIRINFQIKESELISAASWAAIADKSAQPLGFYQSKLIGEEGESPTLIFWNGFSFERCGVIPKEFSINDFAFISKTPEEQEKWGFPNIPIENLILI